MKEINLSDWKRKDHYAFFSQFEEPFFGVTLKIDCTQAYDFAKEQKQSFFLLYLYRALKAANSIEEFRYRIVDKKVVLFDTVTASATINRPDGTFGFSYLDYHEDEKVFQEKVSEEMDAVRKSTGLIPAVSGENVIHCSAAPWLDFTALSHARSFTFPDSSPKISFGKWTEENGVKTMPVSIHAHHGLMDGYHIGLFIEAFQHLMNTIKN